MKLRPSWLTSFLLLCCCHLTLTAKAESLADLYVPGDFEIVDAGFILSSSATPPVSDQWQPIRLPHLWGQERINAQSGWYRIAVPPNVENAVEPQAIYFWRFSMNIAVWANDEFLGDGGSFEEPIARNWNRPHLFLLPKSALKTDDQQNYLYVRLGTYPNWGNLAPVLVGPLDELRPRFDKRFFWQITMSQATFYISMITAIVAFALYAADMKSRMYLYFGLSCLAWSMYSLNLYVQNIPFSAKLWWNLVHSSIEWYGVTLTLFAHQLLKLDTKVFDRILVAFGLITTATYFLVDLDTLARFNSYFHFLTLCLATYLTVLATWLGIKFRAPHSLVFAICSATIVGFGLHDLSMNTLLAASLWQHQFFWLQFSAPILMITMLSILTYRFVLSYREQVNAEQQIRTERERIFSDIHDDVGSKVLSLVYSAETSHQADLARDALREIRAIVAGGTSSGGDLGTVFNSYEAEARERYHEAKIDLNWTNNSITNERISDTQQYHLQRVFRELVSNTIKHAKTQKVEIMIQAEQGQVHVVIRDFGQGLGDSEQGTGIAGVKRRLAELGGQASWSDADPGCRIEIVLPLEQTTI